MHTAGMADPWGAASLYGWLGWAAHSPVFAPPCVCIEGTVRAEEVGLLCMQTRAIRKGWQGHFWDKARIQNYLDNLDEMA